MNISIKVDPDTLFLLQKTILNECQMKANSRSARSGKSMRVELFQIISKRCITYTNNPNGKEMNLTLKHHLANLIYDIICDLKYSVGGIYEINKLDMFRNNLHKLL